MNSNFIVGDVVKLVSSKVKMTVNDISSSFGVQCIWFDKHNKLMREYFSPALLKKIDLDAEKNNDKPPF